MKCMHCGYEDQQNFVCCPCCGRFYSEIPVIRNLAADAVLPALKDNLFLVICILVSAATAMSLVSGNLPLLNILMTIFLWLTFAQSRKNIADAKHLQQISGTVFASYVLNYVLAGILVIAGALCAAAFGILAATPGILESVLSELGMLDASMAELPFDIAEFSAIIGSLSGTVFLIVFLIFGAVLAVVNAFSMRYIHGFTQSVYKSVESGVLGIKYLGAVRGWMITFAVFTGLSALSSLSSDIMTALSNGALCAAYIITAIWLPKYFSVNR